MQDSALLKKHANLLRQSEGDGTPFAVDLVDHARCVVCVCVAFDLCAQVIRPLCSDLEIARGMQTGMPMHNHTDTHTAGSDRAVRPRLSWNRQALVADAGAPEWLELAFAALARYWDDPTAALTSESEPIGIMSP